MDAHLTVDTTLSWVSWESHGTCHIHENHKARALRPHAAQTTAAAKAIHESVKELWHATVSSQCPSQGQVVTTSSQNDGQLLYIRGLSTHTPSYRGDMPALPKYYMRRAIIGGPIASTAITRPPRLRVQVTELQCSVDVATTSGYHGLLFVACLPDMMARRQSNTNFGETGNDKD